MKNLFISISLFIVCNISYAANTTVNPKTTATISSTCSMATNNINYGDITASSTVDIGTKVFASSDINVICSNKVTYNISMSLGSYFASNARNMKGTKGQTIPYSLSCSYDNTPYCAWFGTNYVSGVGTGATQNITVYTSTTKGFYTPDNYSDTLTTIITY